MAALKDLKSKLRSLSKQMPFALSQALTSVARENAAAEKKSTDLPSGVNHIFYCKCRGVNRCTQKQS